MVILIEAHPCHDRISLKKYHTPFIARGDDQAQYLTFSCVSIFAE
jgi:hypothetical protein